MQSEQQIRERLESSKAQFEIALREHIYPKIASESSKIEVLEWVLKDPLTNWKECSRNLATAMASGLNTQTRVTDLELNRAVERDRSRHTREHDREE